MPNLVTVMIDIFLKKNLNASKPSEHPPVRRGKNSPKLIIGDSQHRLQKSSLPCGVEVPDFSRSTDRTV